MATETMTRGEVLDLLVETKRDLRVLPDRLAAGQLTWREHAAEWRRLLDQAASLARGLTEDELRDAHERSRYAR